MPGIQQGTDGKVQAQGENVQRVLVDGKPFFGDDPNAVLKNLPAEVIDRIQVFDQRSDQSQFTGFDDGNSLKTLNIITKPQFRDGVFGRAFAGAGTEDRWKGGATVNLFNKNRRLTFLLNGNNINEQNFSTEDLLGVMSGSSNNNRPQGMRGVSVDVEAGAVAEVKTSITRPTISSSISETASAPHNRSV